jgi:2-keto-3-deoxy-L-rhamnonate aldolase RhmA
MRTESDSFNLLKDPLEEKIAKNETAIGLYGNHRRMAEIASHYGFDWFMFDQMFTGIGWNEAENMLRWCEAAGITPIPRVHSHPWLGYDRRVPVNVSRLLGIGAKYIFVSHSGKQEIEDCIQAYTEGGKQSHRKSVHIPPYFTKEEHGSNFIEDAHIIPQPETSDALETAIEVMKLPEIDMIFFAMGDATRVLGGEEGWETPEVWDLIDHAVSVGEEEDVAVGANTMAAEAYTLDDHLRLAQRLKDHGVDFIMVQPIPKLFSKDLKEFVDGIQDG